ncbi:MAG: hypothetical protein K0R39_4027 [Symbiobacteriaceae bacterium]|jgi:hypothetical protein|nr:hypothetical protein [Symbiobacteriaceae bacterium]
MARNPRHFALLAAAVLTVGGLLALSLTFRLLAGPPAAAPEPGRAGAQAGPDLDGDDRPDHIDLTSTGLTVTSGTGAKLLIYDGTLLPGHRVTQLGGAYPVLFVPTGREEWAAFTYNPGHGLLEMVTWPDGGLRGYGELTPAGGLRHPVVGAGSGARTRLMRLTLDHLRLDEVSTAFEPLREARSTPAEALAAAFEAATLGLDDELGVHFPDPEVARAFAASLRGKLPRGGAVRVAQADEVNAGAEHGHLVPVTVWVSGAEAVAGFTGEAEFASGPGGVQIRRIALEPVALKVTSWAEAVRRAQAAAGTGPLPRRADAPFYGVFRFEAGGKRWGVDAVTGQAERE